MGRPKTKKDICKICGIPLNNQNWAPSYQRNHAYYCSKCKYEHYSKPWQKNHSEYLRKYARRRLSDPKIWKRTKENRRKLHQRKRIEVLKHYSPSLTCKKCGFSNIYALSLDHIHGGGLSHRKKLGLRDCLLYYNWIIKNNFPKIFQVLCMNCQVIKARKNKEFGNNRIKKFRKYKGGG